MSKLRQRETLPLPVRKELVRIMSQDNKVITNTERAFLRARIDYLNSDEIKAFGVKEKKVVKKKVVKKKVVKKKVVKK